MAASSVYIYSRSLKADNFEDSIHGIGIDPNRPLYGRRQGQCYNLWNDVLLNFYPVKSTGTRLLNPSARNQHHHDPPSSTPDNDWNQYLRYLNAARAAEAGGADADCGGDGGVYVREIPDIVRNQPLMGTKVVFHCRELRAGGLAGSLRTIGEESLTRLHDGFAAVTVANRVEDPADGDHPPSVQLNDDDDDNVNDGDEEEEDYDNSAYDNDDYEEDEACYCYSRSGSRPALSTPDRAALASDVGAESSKIIACNSGSAASVESSGGGAAARAAGAANGDLFVPIKRWIQVNKHSHMTVTAHVPCRKRVAGVPPCVEILRLPSTDFLPKRGLLVESRQSSSSRGLRESTRRESRRRESRRREDWSTGRGRVRSREIVGSTPTTAKDTVRDCESASPSVATNDSEQQQRRQVGLVTSREAGAAGNRKAAAETETEKISERFESEARNWNGLLLKNNVAGRSKENEKENGKEAHHSGMEDRNGNKFQTDSPTSNEDEYQKFQTDSPTSNEDEYQKFQTYCSSSSNEDEFRKCRIDGSGNRDRHEMFQRGSSFGNENQYKKIHIDSSSDDQIRYGQIENSSNGDQYKQLQRCDSGNEDRNIVQSDSSNDENVNQKVQRDSTYIENQCEQLQTDNSGSENRSKEFQSDSSSSEDADKRIQRDSSLSGNQNNKFHQDRRCSDEDQNKSTHRDSSFSHEDHCNNFPKGSPSNKDADKTTRRNSSSSSGRDDQNKHCGEPEELMSIEKTRTKDHGLSQSVHDENGTSAEAKNIHKTVGSDVCDAQNSHPSIPGTSKSDVSESVSVAKNELKKGVKNTSREENGGRVVRLKELVPRSFKDDARPFKANAEIKLAEEKRRVNELNVMKKASEGIILNHEGDKGNGIIASAYESTDSIRADGYLWVPRTKILPPSARQGCSMFEALKLPEPQKPKQRLLREQQPKARQNKRYMWASSRLHEISPLKCALAAQNREKISEIRSQVEDKYGVKRAGVTRLCIPPTQVLLLDPSLPSCDAAQGISGTELYKDDQGLPSLNFILYPVEKTTAKNGGGFPPVAAGAVGLDDDSQPTEAEFTRAITTTLRAAERNRPGKAGFILPSLAVSASLNSREADRRGRSSEHERDNRRWLKSGQDLSLSKQRLDRSYNDSDRCSLAKEIRNTFSSHGQNPSVEIENVADGANASAVDDDVVDLRAAFDDASYWRAANESGLKSFSSGVHADFQKTTTTARAVAGATTQRLNGSRDAPACYNRAMSTIPEAISSPPPSGETRPIKQGDNASSSWSEAASLPRLLPGRPREEKEEEEEEEEEEGQVHREAAYARRRDSLPTDIGQSESEAEGVRPRDREGQARPAHPNPNPNPNPEPNTRHDEKTIGQGIHTLEDDSGIIPDRPGRSPEPDGSLFPFPPESLKLWSSPVSQYSDGGKTTSDESRDSQRRIISASVSGPANSLWKEASDDGVIEVGGEEEGGVGRCSTAAVAAAAGKLEKSGGGHQPGHCPDGAAKPPIHCRPTTTTTYRHHAGDGDSGTSTPSKNLSPGQFWTGDVLFNKDGGVSSSGFQFQKLLTTTTTTTHGGVFHPVFSSEISKSGLGGTFVAGPSPYHCDAKPNLELERSSRAINCEKRGHFSVVNSGFSVFNAAKSNAEISCYNVKETSGPRPRAYNSHGNKAHDRLSPLQQPLQNLYPPPPKNERWSSSKLPSSHQQAPQNHDHSSRHVKKAPPGRSPMTKAPNANTGGGPTSDKRGRRDRPRSGTAASLAKAAATYGHGLDITATSAQPTCARYFVPRLTAVRVIPDKPNSRYSAGTTTTTTTITAATTAAVAASTRSERLPAKLNHLICPSALASAATTSTGNRSLQQQQQQQQQRVVVGSGRCREDIGLPPAEEDANNKHPGANSVGVVANGILGLRGRGISPPTSSTWRTGLDLQDADCRQVAVVRVRSKTTADGGGGVEKRGGEDLLSQRSKK